MFYKQIHSDVAEYVNYEDKVIQVNDNVIIQPFSKRSLLVTYDNTGDVIRSLLYFQSLDEKQSAIHNIESVEFKNTSTYHRIDYDEDLNCIQKINHTRTIILITYTSVIAAKHALENFKEFYGKNIYHQKNEADDTIYTTILFANSFEKLKKIKEYHML